MDFITLYDCNDEIVTCTASDVADGNDYLTNLAKRLRVNMAKIKTPPVYTVKRLGAAYALYIAAVRSIGKDNITALDTEAARQDIYAQKARFFKSEYEGLEKKLSAADFEDDSQGYGGGFSVPVWRG